MRQSCSNTHTGRQAGRLEVSAGICRGIGGSNPLGSAAASSALKRGSAGSRWKAAGTHNTGDSLLSSLNSWTNTCACLFTLTLAVRRYTVGWLVEVGRSFRHCHNGARNSSLARSLAGWCMCLAIALALFYVILSPTHRTPDRHPRRESVGRRLAFSRLFSHAYLAARCAPFTRAAAIHRLSWLELKREHVKVCI